MSQERWWDSLNLFQKGILFVAILPVGLAFWGIVFALTAVLFVGQIVFPILGVIMSLMTLHQVADWKMALFIFWFGAILGAISRFGVKPLVRFIVKSAKS